MRLEHAGFDYRHVLEKQPELQTPFGIDLPKYMLPFNQVTSCATKPARIAFWGLNAYCKDEDYDEAQRQTNFAVWCQGAYRKLCNLMELWQEGLGSNYLAGGSIYYSNYIKLVLRENRFKKAVDATKALGDCPKCADLFREIALAELRSLRDTGCVVFVSFGLAVSGLMKPIANEANVNLVCEYHFSRYSRRNTEGLIKELNSNLGRKPRD